MQKSRLLVISLWILILGLGPAAAVASASELSSGKQPEVAAPGTPVRKLQRGFLNIALSPIEIAYEMAKEKRTDTIPPSWFLGLGKGALFSVGRALAGVYEMVTFFAPLPANYEPVVYPEFAWEHLEPPKSP